MLSKLLNLQTWLCYFLRRYTLGCIFISSCRTRFHTQWQKRLRKGKKIFFGQGLGREREIISSAGSKCASLRRKEGRGSGAFF